MKKTGAFHWRPVRKNGRTYYQRFRTDKPDVATGPLQQLRRAVHAHEGAQQRVAASREKLGALHDRLQRVRESGALRRSALRAKARAARKQGRTAHAEAHEARLKEHMARNAERITKIREAIKARKKLTAIHEKREGVHRENLQAIQREVHRVTGKNISGKTHVTPTAPKTTKQPRPKPPASPHPGAKIKTKIKTKRGRATQPTPTQPATPKPTAPKAPTPKVSTTPTPKTKAPKVPKTKAPKAPTPKIPAQPAVPPAVIKKKIKTKKPKTPAAPTSPPIANPAAPTPHQPTTHQPAAPAPHQPTTHQPTTHQPTTHQPAAPHQPAQPKPTTHQPAAPHQPTVHQPTAQPVAPISAKAKKGLAKKAKKGLTPQSPAAKAAEAKDFAARASGQLAPPSKIFGTGKANAATSQSIKEILGAMDGLHKFPVGATSVRIEGSSRLSKFTHGVYIHGVGPATIRLNEGSSHQFMTAAHELGHHIDCVFLRTAGKGFGSHGGDPDVDHLMNTIRQSPTYQHLVKEHQDAVANKQKHHARYVKYLMSPHELFARAYAQYVVGKAGSVAHTLQLDAMVKSGKRVQWQHNEFTDIHHAFDRLFKNKGWLNY